MRKIVASWPLEPRTKDARTISLFYAVVLVVMTSAQLFSLEKFIPLLDTFGLPGVNTGRFIAVALVVFGVLALPFLLRMKVSVAMRWVSMVASWIIPILWLFVSLWVNITDTLVANIGLLGASVTIEPGWWAVCIAISLGVLAAWSSWGLWPGRRHASLENSRKK